MPERSEIVSSAGDGIEVQDDALAKRGGKFIASEVALAAAIAFL